MSNKDTRTNALIRVADYLYERQGRWVPGYELTNPGIGGSEGLRRVRQLRDEYDFDIEHRKMKDSTAHEYRMV